MFQKMLKEVSSEQFPVTLLLDSLDQLDPSNSARQLTWLPTSLPNHVKVIVSTLPEAQYEAFPKLQVRELVSPVYSCSLHDSVKVDHHVHAARGPVWSIP